MAEQPFYHTRPNKFIDRSIFIRTLSYLPKIVPLHEYTYIGFGSYHFDDFKIMHTQLNLQKMISLENDPDIFRRAEFNCPYKCITIRNCTSTDYITTHDEAHSIIWLDYTSPKEIGSQFGDFCSLLGELNANDIIRITLNASPNTLEDNGEPQTLHTRRFSRLKERIQEHIPTDAKETDTTYNKYPLLLLRCLRKAANKILPGTSPYSPKKLYPIACSIYADGQQMVTLTAIVLDNADSFTNVKDCLRECPFATFDWDNPLRISVPSLTPKEMFHINSELPCENAKDVLAEKYFFTMPSEEREKFIDSYINLYKLYPNFHHVNL